MQGYGDGATQRYVKPGEWLEYTVYFENKSTAAAPAQEVWVTSELSEHLDWASLELGEIAFNNQVQLELKGRRRGTATVTQAGTAYQVKMTASLNEATGQFELYLRSYDKSRAAYGYWPESVYAGFLPPNDDSHSGEGHFTFRIRVREDAPDGVMIPAQATIVFDKNAPINTSPAWFNWVNAGESPSATGRLSWEGEKGASYSVSIWSGDPAPASEEAVLVTESGTLTETSWRIPNSLLADGVTYFWQVTTKASDGMVSAGAVYGFELGGRVTCELAPGWNLLSVPFELEEYTGSQILEEGLLELNEAGYANVSTLEPGHAYWLFRTEGGDLDLLPSGSTRTTQPVALVDGWNLIGPTEAGVTLDEKHAVWYYADGYWMPLAPAEDGSFTLEAGHGYFIYQSPEAEPKE